MNGGTGHERARGRQGEEVSPRNLGSDVTSLDTRSGEIRLIEVKGLAALTGTILLTPNERRVAEDRRDCYCLYVVTNCLPAAPRAAPQAAAHAPAPQSPPPPVSSGSHSACSSGSSTTVSVRLALSRWETTSRRA